MTRAITRARGALATLAALAAAAALLDLGGLHRLEDGDSIVPVLVALQRWTPFYWDQERYGMLVPLLAVPVRDPLWNLLLQRALLGLAGLAAVVLLARHALGARWRLAGALAAAALLAAAPAPWLFEYLWSQPYGLSLALALAGLAAAEARADPDRLAPALPGPGRIAAGLALCVAAHWVNAAVGLVLLPLAAARAAVDLAQGASRPALRLRLGTEVALLAAGLGAGQLMIRLYPALTGNPLRLPLGPLPPHEWPRAWASLLGRAWEASGRWPAVLGACAAAGLLVQLAWPAARPHARAALLRAAALCLAALAYALAAGVLRWVEVNAFHWRYLAPAAVLVHLAAVSLLADPVARALREGSLARGVALALVPAAALAVAGPPSLSRVRADLDASAGRYTRDVLAARCTLVTGDYWSVWPAVWHAAWTAHARGLEAPVYGLAHRANPTLAAWAGTPREALRICRVRGKEAEAERALRDFRLWPVRVLERRGTVDVLAPAPPSSPAGARGRTSRPP